MFTVQIRWKDNSMYSSPQRLTEPGSLELRQQGGRWLKGLREERGLSQRDLARLVGTEYYTFISQLEAGRGRIPPDRYTLWAKALEIEDKVFVQTLLQYYDPITHAVLFADGGR
jgi:DNA-binding XRE family transcriptional regulator